MANTYPCRAYFCTVHARPEPDRLDRILEDLRSLINLYGITVSEIDSVGRELAYGPYPAYIYMYLNHPGGFWYLSTNSPSYLPGHKGSLTIVDTPELLLAMTDTYMLLHPQQENPYRDNV